MYLHTYYGMALSFKPVISMLGLISRCMYQAKIGYDEPGITII